MKIFIRLIIFCGLVLAVAGFSKFNSGMVSIYLANYRVDLSLNLVLVILLVSFGISYYFIHLWRSILKLSHKIRQARINYGLTRSSRQLNSAGVYYFEGNYRSCYNEAMKSVAKEFNPDKKFLAYLLAFRAANLLADEDKQASLLSEIKEFKPANWQLAYRLLSATNLDRTPQFWLDIDAYLYFALVAESSNDSALLASCQNKLLTNLPNFKPS